MLVAGKFWFYELRNQSEVRPNKKKKEKNKPSRQAEKYSKTEATKGPRQNVLLAPSSGDKKTAITRATRHIKHCKPTGAGAANPSTNRALPVGFSLPRVKTTTVLEGEVS